MVNGVQFGHQSDWPEWICQNYKDSRYRPNDRAREAVKANVAVAARKKVAVVQDSILLRQVQVRKNQNN